MKFGHEYKTALRDEGFPQEWIDKAIDYKHLKRVITLIHDELHELGLDAASVDRLRELVEQQDSPALPIVRKASLTGEYYSAAQPVLSPIEEEFRPQLRILVDQRTGRPLNVSLTSETKASLQKLARHEMMVAGRRPSGSDNALHHSRVNTKAQDRDSFDDRDHDSNHVSPATEGSYHDARWIQVPLASAQEFFDALEPSFGELDAIRDSETKNIEEEILDVGDAVENVVQPVREGYEATRAISYRDLYFWREMFRLYLEKPIFYNDTERKRGAISFADAKQNLVDYDQKLRSTGLLDKMKTPQARRAAQQFLDLNLHILKAMQFQEMNARATFKILKKFDKQTHLGSKTFLKAISKRYPALLATVPSSNSKGSARASAGFSDAIARDLNAEIGSKVLAIVPQLDDWVCPVCYGMAWRPVNLGCCRAVYCIRCIIKLQDDHVKRCPMCNAETVMRANGKNLDFETMDFLEKFFPLEVKKRQKENEREQMVRDYGEGFVRKDCAVM